MAIADGTFYYPTSKEYDRPENHNLRFEDVRFPSTDGVALHGWFFPASDAVGTIVHCHGNAGNITGHFAFVTWLPACGWNVLCFDYRGYGRSTGKVTRRGTIDDTSAAFQYVRNRDDVDPNAVCVLGQSLGGAVAIVALAQSDLEIAGLCTEGAFAGYRTAARFVTRRTWYLWGASPLIARYLISDDLSPIDFIRDLPAIPKLFICGKNDNIVDYRQTIALHNAAPGPKELWLIENSAHTEALTGEIEGGQERVLDFFSSCVATSCREARTCPR